jgi:hypothetical protein
MFLFQHGKKDVVRALLQEGADPCVFDTNQQTAIDIAQNKEMQQVFAGVLLQAIAVDRYIYEFCFAKMKEMIMYDF